MCKPIIELSPKSRNGNRIAFCELFDMYPNKWYFPIVHINVLYITQNVSEN